MKDQRRRLASILNLHDFERAARRHLPRPIFGYVANAAEDGKTLDTNRQAFDDYCFLPRALVDVSRVSLDTELFGKCYDAPFGIAPMGISALSAYRGDKVLAQAAAKANIPMIMSGTSLIPMEDVAGPEGTDWFQAYLPGDREGIEALIARIEKAGFKNLVITVDYPVPPNSENNVRSGFSSPLRPSLRLALDGLLRPRWLVGTFVKTLLHHGMPHFENNYATRGVPIISKHVNRDFSGRSHLSWEHLALVRSLWTGRLVVKGILHPQDAVRARSAGVDGIIVSNHGGRQLDGTVAPMRALPSIVQAVEDLPVMIDSGFRRGSDVLKALGLGARFVFIGRPFNYAAAYAGKAGVAHAIHLLSDEISRNTALLGITRTAEMSQAHLCRNC
ncbi:FMN-dependent family dehydrogenase [Litchfieldella anticariensis FP35 = DSM 16096]|uniref:FMN-dependent family dehydrogenase n=1 Tax=Litchfieldella anticariensis (strain DSM 16096 / CECT 5854 / CIP 108499 / LMG 22089 / FP35) TaxID=1121939 RepID=S2KLX3_LITA3|nr:alpha-hydroxy acid oxidase [Halomonas anticariensis]EPC01448.1 FMN-dependent family dehydrogenase [Halomonas anticariensis FP35 = DSM 16096]